MKKWRNFYAVFAIALALLLAGCGSAKEVNNEAAETEEKEVETTSNAQDSTYPMTVSPTIASTETEEAGQVLFEDVTFESMPKKMVVFDYGFLDTLDALGVEGVVGVPKDSTLPAHLEKYAHDEYVNVGSLKEPLLEDIAEIGPDVIFISARQATFYEQLKEIAPVLYIGTSQDDYWNTFLASVDIAAKMFGKEAEADEYKGKFDEALEKINALASNYETSLVTMYNEGKLSGFATNSRFGYVYDTYGFKPVTEDIEASTHGSNFGFEAILKFNPQVLFVIDRTAAVGGTSNIQKDLENEIIKKTEAYKNNRIVYLDGPLWYLSGGGLQSELAKIEEILAELK
ncbi:siderophore ABC transporter substrate-binding protein [Calidifontibacillus erzurumensis]|uniref:Siderophore ABC transporter substrate-binding protein n=1 Tax=Calidifontibacillus erzurumensis TaxID=2741433 RepID=A0A8J8GBN2_9BACI|nr:siderophore ABC transporter substrate-binding protein [Calidifontibacillus erzurumensis]NSL50216.1 siderophore ABC transporter substrate-binding protein [Calidifontibacillus erzurumensis]